LITKLAQQAFQGMIKDLDGSGNFNPSGPIHLTALQVSFPSADQGETNSLKTYVNGFDDQTWPSIHFTTTLTDTLGVNYDTDPVCGERQCTTATHTNYSTNVDILSDIVLALLTVAFPVLLGQLIIAAFNIPSGPNQTGGVGCALYDLLPPDIPLPFRRPTFEARLSPSSTAGSALPRRQKIHLCYLNPRFDYRGFLVSANQSVQDRTPTAQIDGPDRLVIDANGSSAFGHYSGEAADFFGDLSYAWSGGASSPNAAATIITFSRGQHNPGDTFEITLTVRVTDVEGSSATASLTVTIFVNPDPISSLCKAKPWLKQCQ
jgi:hypothetical protein